MPHSRHCFFKILVILLGFWFGFDLLVRLVAESLWFQEVNYGRVFWVRLATQGSIATIVTLLSLVFLLGNLRVADRRGWQDLEAEEVDQKVTSRTVAALRLSRLLPLSVTLSLVASLVIGYYGFAIAQIWQTDWATSGVMRSLPQPFHPDQIWLTVGQWATLPGLIGVGGIILAAIPGAMLVRPRLTLNIGAIALSVGLGFILSTYWDTLLQFIHATPFGQADPLFERDIGFYIFSLPIAQLLEFWLIGLSVYGFVAVCLTYLLSGNSLSEGRFVGFSERQHRHLAALAASLMGAIALAFWLSRYELLYSRRGVAYGASYTDVTTQLPVNTGLAGLAGAIALGLFWQLLLKNRPKKRLPIFKTLALYTAIAALSSTLLPLAVQRFVVQPNELARETPFIQRNIAQTREAFNLNLIDVETFNPENSLTLADLQTNERTIRNIRLWDTRPLLQTNRQLQQIRPYYAFPSADIDRYTLLRRPPNQPPTADLQQVLIAARELDYDGVPEEAKTWVNKHLIYTHGYGFTLSPVNQVAPGGLPAYFVRDITTDVSGDTPLNVSSEEIRSSIPITNPRIYFGEISDTYVMTGTRVKEFDYPSEDGNVYTIYDGTGGIQIASMPQRLLFAKYLNDWQMLLTRNFTPTTKVLFRRNINERIRAIAPFLRYDSSPYLVVADTQAPNSNLFWVVDAYTTSDRYPYSDPGRSEFNYIRNSVKVIIDAYNGSANFYTADPSDPIIQTWEKIFPTLLKPLDEMPKTLRSHLRYPVDFFKSQSDSLLTYHMTDPQVFYNREDQWQVPTETYGSDTQPVEPYYLITRLPTAISEEFILLLPFRPNQRTNLIAWLAARSDEEQYGRLLLYTFPKQELVYGTEQIEARINQDPVISQQISLWNRAGSRAVQGNLLIVPIERSLLYVEPIYLEAEQNSLPTLVRVIVAYENQIVMAESLDAALRAVFSAQQQTPAPAIVRPLDETEPSAQPPPPIPAPSPTPIPAQPPTQAPAQPPT
ncbi:UPF0182 family protein [Myxacorys almedinensis]|uniref:UPF0182 protein GS601_13560 n=1 Tax=Myxacorys almedinensis A TaxID=2690445 RepID=A0A8J8CK72_9CYAN|nr:UPF0182 family protein [Myxacorys almedinensis]NDJ18306.1 hypothetical protein [Myxacorys almedinensis A]